MSMKFRYQDTSNERLRIHNPLGLKIIKQTKQINMKKKEIVLTNVNGSTISVAEQEGQLFLVEHGFVSKRLLPDGVYQSDGLTFPVKDGKRVQSKFSSKPGMKPMAKKIPITPIHKKMEAKRQERKEQIEKLNSTGKI